MISDTKPERTSKSVCASHKCMHMILICWIGCMWCGQTWFFFSSKFRFIVRDFQYNEEEMKADKEEMNRLSTDKKKQFVCDVP